LAGGEGEGDVAEIECNWDIIDAVAVQQRDRRREHNASLLSRNGRLRDRWYRYAAAIAVRTWCR
jgi:hypothetical protein